MFSAIIASALSVSLYHASSEDGYIHPPTRSQTNELVQIDKRCRAFSQPTLGEKLTASVQPRLRFVACLKRNVAASPALAGWHIVPTQTQAAQKK